MPYTLNHKKITMVAALSGLAVILVLGFVFGNIRDVIFGAPLSIDTVSDGTTLSSGFLPISGNAQHARTVSINGRPIVIDRNGNFTDGVLLSPGYNVVEIALRDQFGKEKVKTYHLVLDQNGTDAAAVATTTNSSGRF
jgi:hypothetical protein